MANIRLVRRKLAEKVGYRNRYRVAKRSLEFYKNKTKTNKNIFITLSAVYVSHTATMFGCCF